MNYIKHLTAFLEKVQKDERLSPAHISLYLALFHYWNLNMFNNPICVSRAQLLELCKIGSQHTYYKCLKELHLYGYIQYIPSHNPSNGCKVYLCIFDITSGVSCANMHNLSCKNDITIAAKMHKYGCKNDITLAAKMQPSINNINNKTYCRENSQTQIENSPQLEFKIETDSMDQKDKRKKVALKKENIDIPPSLDQVKDFFKLEKFPEIESHKFFNHFQSNGWKVGGKSPMKDWHAAARNWMLNAQKFTNTGNPNSTNLSTNKRYDIPL